MAKGKKDGLHINLDIFDEQPLLLIELARELPCDPSYDSLSRWCRLGRQIAPGVRIKMECIMLPNGLGSSVAAYRRFVQRLNDYGI